jgi:3-dehydroquinate synthetase
VLADEREAGAAGGRITLNLGHSVGHGLEAADGYRHLLHGEAVAFGLRAAARIGAALDVTPPDRLARLEALLDRLALGQGRLAFSAATVLAAMRVDKKQSERRLRWVLPTADGVVVRSDVPDELVETALGEVLAGAATSSRERG